MGWMPPSGSGTSPLWSRSFFEPLHCGFRSALAARSIDFLRRTQNNFSMARPEAVRRVKSYSAATGHVYQYYFYEVQKAQRGVAPGTEYVYVASSDRKKAFPLRIFVRRDATEKWEQSSGRTLSGTEEYAIAKIRLFQALDEIENLETHSADIFVDQSNLDSLLSQLDL